MSNFWDADHWQAFGGGNTASRPQVPSPEGKWGREQAFSPRSCAAWFCRVAITPAEGRYRSRHDPQQQRAGTKTTTEVRYRTQRDLKRQEVRAKTRPSAPVLIVIKICLPKGRGLNCRLYTGEALRCTREGLSSRPYTNRQVQCTGCNRI